MAIGVSLIERLSQQLSQTQSEELSLSQQQLWAQDKWEGRLTTGPKCKRMLPAEYREGTKKISIKAAKKSERETSTWMSLQKLAPVIRFYQENRHSVRLARGLYVEVGLGNWRGYRHIRNVIRAGLTPLFYDFVEQALADARIGLGKSLDLPAGSPVIRGMVRLGEATQICQSLDPNKVRIFIASTLFEHIGFGLPEAERLAVVILTIESAGRILQNPLNQVLIINTPPHDEKRVGSIGLEDDFIFEHLQLGAQRKLWRPDQSRHQSATSVFTSMLVRADIR